MMRTVSFIAQWDDDAQVWWADCQGPEGIATEAATIEALRERLKLIVPDYLAAGGEKTDGISIELIVKYTDLVAAE